MKKVLIANRGEIAVRVIRACRDAGLRSVAVYAEQDREAPHVRMADEAYALGGSTAADTYLDIERLITVAGKAQADAVHPGYGFLSENAAFARAVIDAGLVWIGPSPEAISALGDKVAAREIARRVGAPLAPGTDRPVASAAEAEEFARRHGLPIAIKAAYGGGGRGLKVARTLEEVPELLESATREAVAAFGNGDCFVERYLDRARHVETQCLADAYGNVVVVSTRDCSLQRRHQKLVEEAPAPFLTPDQDAMLRTASKAILRDVGYVGAGTCEFLLSEDGLISFLEVNTRLQVEHPVSEEVTRIDLVLEQFRIASGEPLGYDDPPVQGHSIEFRINGEDVGRGYLPTPGTITRWRVPTGPGIRIAAGVEAGTVVGSAFDSMLAKLIVTGTDRDHALARARRALAEFEVDGLPTTLPLHRLIVDAPEFAPPEPSIPMTVHTRWLETGFQGQVEPWAGDATDPAAPAARQTLTVEVDGRQIEVVLPAGTLASIGAAQSAPAPSRQRPAGRGPASRRRGMAAAAGGNTLTSPMQGTVVKIAVTDGQVVAAGDTIFVVEAMKMEQPVTAHRAGAVGNIAVSVGDAVTGGAPLCDIRDTE